MVHGKYLLTAFAMLPLAANSWLCRAALRDTDIDPASFTSLRLLSGALMLWLLPRLTGKRAVGAGSWPSALALFGYAALFSFAYLGLSSGTGALLLFGAVQVTMIAFGLRAGERLDALQIVGVLAAFAGLAGLLWPGLTAPPLASALMMLAAGIAWGIYSVRGRATTDPVRETAGNFLLAVPFALALGLFSLFTQPGLSVDPLGLGYAIASGALTSGLGYVLWYQVARQLTATSAGTVQLSVPVIVAIGGVILLGEPITPRLAIASVAVLGGIAIVIVERGRRHSAVG